MKMCRVSLFFNILCVFVTSSCYGAFPTIYQSSTVSTTYRTTSPFLDKKDAFMFVHAPRQKRAVEEEESKPDPPRPPPCPAATCAASSCPAGQRCYVVEYMLACPATGCIDVNECESNPCQNGATCNNGQNRYSCTCVPGWKGTNCELDVNECESNPCQNGATCNNGQNRYSCTCVPGWKGTNCELDIDECLSQPCQNGATCNNLQNHYTCTCAEDFVGTNCETDTCDSSQQSGADIVLVVDSSASLSQLGFDKLKTYAKTFVSYFPIGPTAYQVAIVSYSFSPTIHCHLNTYYTEADLHDTISKLEFVDGASYTGSALRLVRQDVLTTAKGIRSNLNSYVIVLTDGMSSDITDTKSQAKQLKRSGATLFSVAFGSNIYHTELLDITSDSSKVFLSTFQDPAFTILKNQLPLCPDCFRNSSDVAIIFDASSELGSTQFYPAIDVLIKLIGYLQIGPNKAHVSFLTYGQTVQNEFDFNQYQTTDDVVTHIVANLKQNPGPANLSRALDYVTHNVFTEIRGRRSNARKLAVVLTPGNFNDLDIVKASAEILKNSGVTLAMIGVGTEVSTNLTSLTSLATNPALAFVIGETIGIQDNVLRSMTSVVEFDVCEFD